MSGGHYDYKYYKLEELADDIEREFINDGKYEDKDWTCYDLPENKRPTVEYDRIEDAKADQRPIILKEIKSLNEGLRKCSKRTKELEWYLSGDTSAESYLKRLREANLL